MAKSGKKRKIFGPWFLKEWRLARNLTLEQLASRVGSTAASISRLENRRQPYSQPFLEALADALTCRPGDLISRPPGVSDALREVIDGMAPEDQAQALAVLKALKQTKAA
jgi:transcriptional regulator with XRE-family HTH domain